MVWELSRCLSSTGTGVLPCLGKLPAVSRVSCPPVSLSPAHALDREADGSVASGRAAASDLGKQPADKHDFITNNILQRVHVQGAALGGIE